MHMESSKQEIIKKPINKCFVSMSKNCLEIRPNETYFSAAMLRSCLPMIIAANALCLFVVINKYEYDGFMIMFITSIIFLFFLLGIIKLFISQITKISNIVFNRKTKKCYVYYRGITYINDLDDVIISGGAKTMISMHHRSAKGISVTKSIEIDDEWNIKVITNYIKSFTSQGSDGLAIPTEYEWIDREKISIAFPPLKSLRHYAPWPFCGKITDPLEKSLKIYMWPFYILIYFPFNISASLIWYPFTKIFNIKPHPVPEEAYEGDNSIRVTPDLATKGIRS